MIGFAAAAGALMFTVLALGTGLTGNSELPPVKPKPALEAADYDPATVIAPTLAEAETDPNAPIPIGEPVVPAIGQQPQYSQGQAPAAVQQRQQSSAEALREAARRSTLIAYGGERGTGNVGGNPSGPYGDSNSAGAASPQQTTNLDTLRRASVIGQAQARSLPDRNFLITAGSFIPCVLQTAMDSSQPGYVSCIVPRNVYSDNGRVVLLEKGTRIFGEYQGGLNRGQYRLFVLWTRAVTPRGIAIDVGSPATDALGRGGVDGKVENFFWKRFGTALLFSLVEDAATVGAEAVGNNGSNTTRVPSDAASTVLQQNGDIKPVLRKNQGEDVGITVAQDFDFSAVYGLALK
ncbi:type IV secretion system protein VirB10 [Sphingopyxis sp. BSNA05]|uniref:type IV secretion system protein VirB10 n=1 Tax=Sphingopyxis sp. BSNA05 TaxID=1236614 RepID=UPI00156716AD|nr:type IV secretion system protein VirB10 [Sphingopyxis sp. BSNA05]NRD88198.1 type IV secretion system protein VirB10 [Sphingopyxis sp. BSNA05]